MKIVIGIFILSFLFYEGGSTRLKSILKNSKNSKNCFCSVRDSGVSLQYKIFRQVEPLGLDSYTLKERMSRLVSKYNSYVNSLKGEKNSLHSWMPNIIQKSWGVIKKDKLPFGIQTHSQYKQMTMKLGGRNFYFTFYRDEDSKRKFKIQFSSSRNPKRISKNLVVKRYSLSRFKGNQFEYDLCSNFVIFVNKMMRKFFIRANKMESSTQVFSQALVEKDNCKTIKHIYLEVFPIGTKLETIVALTQLVKPSKEDKTTEAHVKPCSKSKSKSKSSSLNSSYSSWKGDKPSISKIPINQLKLNQIQPTIDYQKDKELKPVPASMEKIQKRSKSIKNMDRMVDKVFGFKANLDKSMNPVSKNESPKEYFIEKKKLDPNNSNFALKNQIEMAKPPLPKRKIKVIDNNFLQFVPELRPNRQSRMAQPLESRGKSVGVTNQNLNKGFGPIKADHQIQINNKKEETNDENNELSLILSIDKNAQDSDGNLISKDIDKIDQEFQEYLDFEENNKRIEVEEQDKQIINNKDDNEDQEEEEEIDQYESEEEINLRRVVDRVVYSQSNFDESMEDEFHEENYDQEEEEIENSKIIEEMLTNKPNYNLLRESLMKSNTVSKSDETTNDIVSLKIKKASLILENAVSIVKSKIDVKDSKLIAENIETSIELPSIDDEIKAMYEDHFLRVWDTSSDYIIYTSKNDQFDETKIKIPKIILNFSEGKAFVVKQYMNSNGDKLSDSEVEESYDRDLHLFYRKYQFMNLLLFRIHRVNEMIEDESQKFILNVYQDLSVEIKQKEKDVTFSIAKSMLKKQSYRNIIINFTEVSVDDEIKIEIKIDSDQFNKEIQVLVLCERIAEIPSEVLEGRVKEEVESHIRAYGLDSDLVKKLYINNIPKDSNFLLII